MKRDNQLSDTIATSGVIPECFQFSPADGFVPPAILWRDTEEKHNDRVDTVVVPLNGTTHAEHALPAALAIVRRTGAKLRIVHVYSEPFGGLEPWQQTAAFESTRIEHRDYLERITRQIARNENVTAEISLIESPDTIDALTKGVSDSSLVVMGSRRRRFASRLWWQNTVDLLRRKLSVPLLVIEGDGSPVELIAAPDATQILLPLDGTAPDQTVLDCATFAIESLGGTITLLNVQNEDWTAGLFPHLTPKDYLSWTIERLKQTGISASAYVLTSPQDPRAALQTYAESNKFDLIAIPTQGDGGFSRMMRSSVADYLLRHSRIPVLLQPIPGRATRPELTRVT